MKLVSQSKNLPPNSCLDLEEIEKVIDDIEDLQPFAYKIAKDGKDNIVTNILATGDETLVEHLYSLKSACQIRSMILSPSDESLEHNLQFNRFDLCSGTTSIKFSFVDKLLDQQTHNRFKITLHYLLDQMVLNDVFSLINLIALDINIGVQNQIDLILSITINPKFMSMFRGSLQWEQQSFMTKLQDLLQDEECFEM